MPHRPHLTRRRVLRVAVALPLVVLLAVAADLAWALSRVERPEVRLTGTTGGTTYLLLGSDDRSSPLPEAARRTHVKDAGGVHGARADVVVLVRVPDEGRPRLVVVPRDLLVTTADRVPRRLGTALLKGPGEVAASLCREGIGVDHVVVVDFAGVVALVDAVGGVEVATDAPWRDTRSGLDLPVAGRQRVDGLQALALVRARHLERLRDGRWQPAPDLDPGRPERMLKVLGQVAERLDSPWRARAALHAVAPHLTGDPGLGPWQSLRLARALDDARGSGARVVPVRLRDGAVPTAYHTTGTREVLRTVVGPSECRTSQN